VHILLSNLNPSWGGGELWFFNAARELANRGHEVRVLVREDSRLNRRLEGSVELVSEEVDPFEGRTTDVMLCNSRKKDVRHLFAFKSRPAHGLVLRKGIARPIKDRMWGRKELHALCHILTNSNATMAVVKESLPWFPEDRITRIYNPVFFEPRPHEPGDGVLRILSVARLVQQKGIDVLLAALATVEREWTLTLAGDGREREALETQASELGIAGRCRFLGHVEDVAALYARCDLVAIPSRYEGFCFTAAEAALSALPIVATTADSLPETARGATFVPVDDAPALAAAIENLEPGPRTGAQAEAREMFGPARIFDELEALLDRASHEGPAREAGRTRRR
jgi:glycosyltransferase involved in cell wall biosynthesis